MKLPTLIRKAPHGKERDGNMPDYDEARRSFTWERARAELDVPDGTGLNIAYEALDRHLHGPAAGRVAIRYLGRKGEKQDFTYRDLTALTNRFANVLSGLGVGKGDRVFSLCGRVPALYISALGTLKRGAVYCPLFSSFGPEPIQTRMIIGAARVLVTTAALYRRKIAPIRKDLPCLEHVLIVGEERLPADSGCHSFDDLLANANDRFRIPDTDPEDMALLHFTSGTTGKPKAAVHVHAAVIAHHITGRLALDFHPGDVFWCTADPGWVTGTSYGIIAPLTNATTMIVDEGGFDAERWYRVLQDENVTVWYTSPTVIRMLMRAGADLPRSFDLSRIRFAASVGEPLNPEAVTWGDKTLGFPFHDNWWQTETGGIMIANYASLDIKPGSMGKPLPGIEAAIVRRRDGGGIEILSSSGIEGELALKTGWPSMFRNYLGEEERYRTCFAGDWYLSGDIVKRDDDGYFWFVSRADDVIKSAGHLIGPFEVESALMEHPSVAEAAVIGLPDPIAKEVVKAYVSLRKGQQPSEALRRELMAHARQRLGPTIAPREIAFERKIPKTRSGKIMRRLLKARELGLAEGDVSMLEEED